MKVTTKVSPQAIYTNKLTRDIRREIKKTLGGIKVSSIQIIGKQFAVALANLINSIIISGTYPDGSLQKR